MKITIGGLSSFITIGDPQDATSIPVVAHQHGEPEKYMKVAREVLEDLGLDNSVVRFIPTVSLDSKNEIRPYAEIVYEKGVEEHEEIMEVANALLKVGLDVEIPQSLQYFYRGRN